jgi:sec-independent protein translocase protein TatA
MFGLSTQELLVLGVVAIILFGKRLPEVAKTLGKKYADFRRGLSDIQSQFDLSDTYSSRPARSSYAARSTQDDYDDYDEATAPRFQPPPGEPQVEPPANPSASESS